jgi:hypothetical protein
MEVKFYDLANPVFLDIMWRLAIDIVSLFILIRLIYYKYSGKEKFLFSFFLMGILTFFIASVLNAVFLAIAGAFGLFAVLGILRMRTRNFSVKDMSYTFATLGISVINALNIKDFPLFGILAINFVILLTAYILEQFLLRHKSERITIVYENIEMLRPERKQKLIEDIELMTGKKIIKVNIRRIDYIEKTALLDLLCKGLPE